MLFSSHMPIVILQTITKKKANNDAIFQTFGLKFLKQLFENIASFLVQDIKFFSPDM